MLSEMRKSTFRVPIFSRRIGSTATTRGLSPAYLAKNRSRVRLIFVKNPHFVLPTEQTVSSCTSVDILGQTDRHWQIDFPKFPVISISWTVFLLHLELHNRVNLTFAVFRYNLRFAYRRPDHQRSDRKEQDSRPAPCLERCCDDSNNRISTAGR